MILEINNFQSIEHCKLEIPEKSFTCLVGPTNVGKSAIRRALECVLYNKSEVSYIRKGCTSCEVSLTLADGTSIKWSRDKKTAQYEINGETFSKLSGSVPELIQDKGFRELSLSKDKLTVQVAHQFENIFLLNQPGGKVTEVLSSLGNLHNIIEANKICSSDKKATKSKLKIRNEDLVLENQKLKSFSGVDKSRECLDNYKKDLKEIRAISDRVSKAKILNGKLRSSLVKKTQYSKALEVQPPVFDLDTSKVNSLKLLDKKYSSQIVRVEALAKIKTVDEGIFKIDLDDDLKKYILLKSLKDKLVVKKNTLEKYSEIPEPVTHLEIDSSSVINMKKILTKLKSSKEKLLSYRSDLNKLDDKLVNLDKEYTSVRKELKICPLCDSSLT